MKYSVIIPVFNRPDEVGELLQSLCRQTCKDFEVIVVEDGSSITCKDVCDKYADILSLHYYYKQNSGPGQSRNYGAERANGEWLIILDSDVVLPEGYMESLEGPGEGLPAAFGGPDTAHPDFTPVQKAISYAMTSFFTTGGIRGGSSPQSRGAKGASSSPQLGGTRGAPSLDKFFPRSYNMGIRREVYQELGGFSNMRFGEDIDFSYRIVEAGYKTALIPEAWVWHKRRTDFRKFFRQVYNSGIARINLTKRHPGTLKLVHLLPTVFTLGVIGCLIAWLVGEGLFCYGTLHADPAATQPRYMTVGLWISIIALLPILLFSALILVDSTIRNRSLRVGLLSIAASFTQLMGYGLGFIEAWWKRCILKQDEPSRGEQTEDERTAFEKKFYN